MKKVMTPAEKAQYFGLYLEQKVAIYNDAPGLWVLSLEFMHDVLFHGGCISLRSIEQITDEEKLMIGRIGSAYTGNRQIMEVADEWIDEFRMEGISSFSAVENQEIIDTLRSIGIATPWKQYSIHDLIDNGVLKFES